MKNEEQVNLISKNEMTPLNEKLYSDFSVEELESRLETDPLLLNNIFNLSETSPGCKCKNKECTHCSHVSVCPELSICICDNKIRQ